MTNQTDIERVQKIDIAKVSSPLKVKPEELSDKQVEAPDHELVYYAVSKGGHTQSIFDTILKTLAGENTAGKIIAEGKDVASHFIPKGQYLDEITDEIGDLLKSKIQPKKKN